MKRGDVVLYSQLGKVYNALVLGLNESNDERKGAKGEPSLHLAVILDDPAGKPLPFGQTPHATEIFDVVHFTHEFSAAYGDIYGPESFAHRGAGEWMETLPSPKLTDFKATARVVKGSKAS